MAKKIFLVLLSVFCIFLIASAFYIYRNMQPVEQDQSGGNVSFVVEKGESLFSVIDRLYDSDLIRNNTVVKLYVKFIYPAAIKNGTYSVSSAMTPVEILKVLESGVQELVKVTIPEGLTSRQIAEILKDAEVINSEDEFLSLVHSADFASSLGVDSETLEGYLYPDTYRFQQGFPSEKVISHLVKTFFHTLKEIYPYYDEFTKEKMEEKIILASIVEKEYRVDGEAPVIASVFYNRLNIGMPLQSCATVIYVITEELGKKHPVRIFESDLKLESPFNTYYNSSLPPAPIANPGYVALNAAFNPAQTEYLFFVVEDPVKGTHTFTSTLSDHNKARQLYLEGFRSK